MMYLALSYDHRVVDGRETVFPSRTASNIRYGFSQELERREDDGLSSIWEILNAAWTAG